MRHNNFCSPDTENTDGQNGLKPLPDSTEMLHFRVKKRFCEYFRGYAISI